MSAYRHLFLSTITAPFTQRWEEAFPQGRALDLVSLMESLRVLPADQCCIWLSSFDPQWHDYVKTIQKVQPAARIVLLSNAPEPTEGMAALDAGVRAYAHAHAVPSLLQELALVVEHGGLWVGPELMQRLVGATHRALVSHSAAPAAQDVPNAWELLSAREAQVARAVAEGKSNREVAERMFISERTVKAHLGAIFEKLGVRDRLQLVVRLAASPGPEASA